MIREGQFYLQNDNGNNNNIFILITGAIVAVIVW